MNGRAVPDGGGGVTRARRPAGEEHEREPAVRAVYSHTTRFRAQLSSTQGVTEREIRAFSLGGVNCEEDEC